MRMRSPITKMLVILIAAFTIGILSFTPILVKAAIPPQVGFCKELQCLQPIAVGVYQILEKVNSLPDMLARLVSDDLLDTRQVNFPPYRGSDAITNEIINNFAKLGTAIIDENKPTNPALQKEYLNYFFGGNPATVTKNLPYANDLSYITLLDAPYLDPDPRRNMNPRPDPKKNYVRNASGYGLLHTAPGLNWRGSQEDQLRYFNFYSTVSAIQTFNSYVMTQLLTQTSTFTQTQTTLINQANSSEWIKHVATEQIGKVFRQTLLFDSQIFVVLTQLLETQKKLLAAQTMNNNLLIMMNQQTEELLIKKATGQIQG